MYISLGIRRIACQIQAWIGTTPEQSAFAHIWQQWTKNPTEASLFTNLITELAKTLLDPQQVQTLDLIWQSRLSPSAWHAQQFEHNQAYDQEIETEEEQAELVELHDLWIQGDGCLLVFPDIQLQKVLPQLARGKALIIPGDRAVFNSERWGPIDLTRLNDGPTTYPNNTGQAELFRDLAIVLERPRLGISNSKKHWGTATKAKKLYIDQRWNNVQIRWQQFLWYRHRIDWQRYQGAEGYDRFTIEHFQGNSKKAYEVASSLLTKDEFVRLKWGKQKHTNVSEQEGLRQILRTGLVDGSLTGETGYDRFAIDNFQGAAKKAYEVASSLLTKDEFTQLKWGKSKHTNVSEQEGLRQILRTGLADGSLTSETGYDRFAIEHFQGSSFKASLAAKSLLTKDEFTQLKWGKAKKTNVSEQEGLRQILRTGLADGSLTGETGYDRFAIDNFQGDLQKTYKVVSSLLTKDEFTRLKWGKQKHNSISEQEGLRQILRTGLADGSFTGETGYDRFAIDIFQGDSKKAYLVASSLLTKDEFTQLKWGKAKQTNVSEQEGLRQILRTGLADRSLTGEIGYDRFAIDIFQGDSKKAYLVASSLLTKDEFARLKWGKVKQTNVSEQGGLRQILRTGLANGSLTGETGYDRFAIDIFQGDSKKAYEAVSSLLTKDEFARLNWGKQKTGRLELQIIPMLSADRHGADGTS